jgi:hypothetical protein
MIKITAAIALPRFPATVIGAGIKNGDQLKNSRYGSVITRAGDEANAYGRGSWGDGDTTASSLAGVWADGLNDFWPEQVNLTGCKILNNYLPDDRRKLENEAQAVMRRAYTAFSASRHNSRRRVHEKGFDRYAVGTGQTLMAVKGYITGRD